MSWQFFLEVSAQEWNESHVDVDGYKSVLDIGKMYGVNFLHILRKLEIYCKGQV